ncbi:MAG: serine/threonine protein kinase [Gemmataceae bacterium]|nr:serine/threonine protein kinase [Gemmataceae bacterium]
MNDATAAHRDAPTEHDANAIAPIGFELLEIVGRGGMGVVHRARDVRLGREVAVKFLKESFPADSAPASRFLDEARITAQLQHPGIPAVYQVGTLPDGRPFLAMKLIKGRTLDEIVKAGVPADALAVIEAVGQAVGYAHSRGVIHRDLKPANVMVGTFGEIQVMDWGLAKTRIPAATPPASSDPEATAAQTEVRSLRDSEGNLTRAGSILGTPAYMAPEQAAGENDKVGPASDVFGLGAILCVLLTGKPPFVGKDAESVRINAMRGKTEDAFDRLDACAADPDLVALCKRCLAFDPADRPQSGEEVADRVAELRRAAADRAREAEHEKRAAVVRAQEQARKRRAVQWAAVAIALVLLAGVIGTTVGLVQATAAQRAAESAERVANDKRIDAENAERAEAEQKSIALAKEAEATAMLKFIQDRVFAAGRLRGERGGLGKDVTLREALAAAQAHLAGDFANQPTVEAKLRSTMATTYRSLGEYNASLEQAQAAWALANAKHGRIHTETIKAAVNIAESYSNLFRYGDARRWAEDAASAAEQLHGPDHVETRTAKKTLARILGELTFHVDALKLQEELYAADLREFGPEHLTTLQSQTDLGMCRLRMGRTEDARKLIESALSGRQKLLAPDHPDILRSMNYVGYVYRDLGRYAEADAIYERMQYAARQTLPPDHSLGLMATLGRVNALVLRGQAVQALAMIESTEEQYRKTLGPDHPHVLRVANVHGNCLSQLQRFAEALSVYEDLVARNTRIWGPEHHNTLLARNNRAAARMVMNANEDVAKELEDIVAVYRKSHGLENPNTLRALHNLGVHYSFNKRAEDGVKILYEVVVVSTRVLGIEHPDTLQSQFALITALEYANRSHEALRRLEELLSVRRRVLGTENPRTLDTMSKLALWYVTEKYVDPPRFTEAIALLDDTIAARKRILAPGNSTIASDVKLLTSIQIRQKKAADEVTPLQEQLAKLEKTLPESDKAILEKSWNLAYALLKVDRGEEAVPLLDRCQRYGTGASGKAYVPNMLTSSAFLRAHFHLAKADGPGNRTAAELYEKLNWQDGESYFNSARLRALAAESFAKAKKPDEAKAEADRAMEWLSKAKGDEKKKIAKSRIVSAKELYSLRDREDYKKLLADWP